MYKYSPTTHYVDTDFKKIPIKSVLINRNTPRGDPADILELMPHDGRRAFKPVGTIHKNGTFDIANCLMTSELKVKILGFMKQEGLKKDPDHLWHDGREYRKGLRNWR